MEINVIGRHIAVPDRFRSHLDAKLEKVTQLAPRSTRIEVEISHESNPRQTDLADRVELTVYDSGQVVRSEARADDLYAALDVAYGKLLERLRRARDRRKAHRPRRGPSSVRTDVPAGSFDPLPTSLVDGLGELGEDQGRPAEGAEVEDAPHSPVVIREKRHEANPMTIDEALYEMELVGHDFYLFVDAETRRPKVVYRRRGWNYGVIELVVKEQAATGSV